MFRRKNGAIKILRKTTGLNYGFVDNFDHVFPCPRIRIALSIRDRKRYRKGPFLLVPDPCLTFPFAAGFSARKVPLVLSAIAQCDRDAGEMNGRNRARRCQVDPPSIRHESSQNRRRLLEFRLMHPACTCCPNMAAAIIRLQKRRHVDHGQPGVVEQPIVHFIVTVINGLRSADVDSPIRSPLVGEAHDAFACDGSCGQVLPCFSSILTLQYFVAVLCAGKHTPKNIRVGPVDIQVNGLVVVAAIFCRRRGRNFPRTSSIRRAVNAPEGST